MKPLIVTELLDIVVNHQLDVFCDSLRLQNVREKGLNLRLFDLLLNQLLDISDNGQGFANDEAVQLPQHLHVQQKQHLKFPVRILQSDDSAEHLQAAQVAEKSRAVDAA